MAAITGFQSTTTDQYFIPTMYSKLVLAARHRNLVAAKLFANRTSDGAKGSSVQFPIKSLMTATAWTQGNRLTDSLNATSESYKSITMNQEYVAPFHITKRLKDQSLYDSVALSAKESQYAVEKQIDTQILSNVDSFTTTPIGGQGVAITNLVCTAAKEALDVNDVPATDRFWILDPRCRTDLFNLTGNYFTSMDFAGEKGLQTGKVGYILGDPVYFSTNLPFGMVGSPSVAFRKNVYAHKEAIGVVLQRNAEYEIEYDIDTQGWIGNTSALWGSGVLRPDHGVVICGR